MFCDESYVFASDSNVDWWKECLILELHKNQHNREKACFFKYQNESENNGINSYTGGQKMALFNWLSLGPFWNQPFEVFLGGKAWPLLFWGWKT